jgi:hypothetical protein
LTRPPKSISSAAPSTTSNAAAVITSRAPERARMPKNGLMHVATRQKHDCDSAHAKCDALPKRRRVLLHAERQACDHRNSGEQRHDHQIFEQQNRNVALPCLA